MAWLGSSPRRLRMEAKGLAIARTAHYRGRYVRLAEELTQVLQSKTSGAVRAVLLDRAVAHGKVPGPHQFPLWVILADGFRDTALDVVAEAMYEVDEKNGFRLWLHASRYSVTEFLDQFEGSPARLQALLQNFVIVYDDGLLASIAAQPSPNGN